MGGEDFGAEVGIFEARDGLEVGQFVGYVRHCWISIELFCFGFGDGDGDGDGEEGFPTQPNPRGAVFWFVLALLDDQ